MVAEVLIPVAVDQTYSYRVPPDIVLEPGASVEVPLGTRRAVGLVFELRSVPGGGANLKPVAARLPFPVLRRPLLDFIDWVARWTTMPRGMVLRMAVRPMGQDGTEPVRLVYRAGAEAPSRPTPARLRVMAALAGGEALSKPALAAAAGVSAGVVDALVGDGAVLAEPRAARPAAGRPDPDRAGLPLDPLQRDAARALVAAVDARAFGVTLLEGVTGSGKTDVYFEAVAATLRAGRQVLIMLPEIALTGQFMTRFAARFGTEPAEWHSEVGSRRRAAVWQGVASGEVRVVAGARSSLFLPFSDLGLIVVDEEHEAAYKQDEGITYHARDMAVIRGRLEGAAVVLASATPSVETRVNAEQGRYGHLRLPVRFGAKPLPRLEAIDMRRTPPARGSWLAPQLVGDIEAALLRGEQALLFLNRRGYAPLTLCRTCGHRFRCPDCTAWLVEHRFRGTLVCHHCGHIERRPVACPACDAPDSLVPCGPGVERLAEEVTRRFPEARTLLLSSDMPGGAPRLRQELAAVAAGAVDIVIGTQLVAKGHHFPLLTLVGVVDADVGLANGDPRAAERTFQLLQQVTGRAGRGDKPGRALLQTFEPEHPVMAALLSGDVEAFYRVEIAGRVAAGLPPFGRLAALVVSATDRAAAETHARALARAAAALAAGTAIVVLGPAEAPIAMIRGRHRLRLLIKAPRSADLQAFLRSAVGAAPPPRGSVTVAVDVDPLNFM